MTNLLWPGDHRAGALMSDAALWRAMLRVEGAWLEVMSGNGLIPPEAADCDLATLVTDDDRETVSVAAEAGANPIIGLVALLRERAPEPARQWVHRGLTSQDVLDTALMLTLREALGRMRVEIAGQLDRLCDLTVQHRRTAMVARTLTKSAVPTTFGVKSAAWLQGLCDAARSITGVVTPIQIGGAAGTLAATTEMVTLLQECGAEGSSIALRLSDHAADVLGLGRRVPWHTNRAPITAIGDALVDCTDSWGRIAGDVLTLNRPEIGELAEGGGDGRGGSSTMPDKNNPVLSVLLRRTALTGPPMAAALHAAASFNNDERADGAWHAEWETLRTLARRTLVAASHATDLLGGLSVNAERMAANLAAAAVSGEQHTIAALIGKPPSSTYLGAADQLIDTALQRARQQRKELE